MGSMTKRIRRNMVRNGWVNVDKVPTKDRIRFLRAMRRKLARRKGRR